MASESSNGNAVSVSSGNSRALSGKSSDSNRSLGEIWFHLLDGGAQKGGQVQHTDLKLSLARGASSQTPSISTDKDSNRSSCASSHTKGRKNSQSPGGLGDTEDSYEHEAAASNADEQKRKRRKVLSEDKRKERNAREQDRSNKISDQFAELRELLVSSGIVVPKGTKGAVLSVVLEYIRVLQQKRINTEA